MVRENQRVVLVTGASSGIGLACAQFLGERGFRVYGTSRKPGTSTPAVTMLAADVTDDRSVEQAIGTVLAHEGRLDIVVNNAGMGIAGSIEDTSVEDARRQLDVNLFGVFRVCRAALPGMRSRGSGYIVNIGSIGGLIALPYQGMYSASKFALEGLSEALRMEVRQFGIRVVLIEPGDYKTGFTQNRQTIQNTYGKSCEVALAKAAHDEQNGPRPEQIARLVYRVVNQRHPRLRYTTGQVFQRAAVWLKRLLPNGLVEYGLRLYYGL
jgi:NAD(P)-dependent dehydrogenase (short-subunit alcohol dehydrogenase family)